MIDAILKVTCNKCGEVEEIEPQHFYRDYSGKTPFIDLSEQAITKELSKRDWDHGEKEDICPDCRPFEDDEEDDEESLMPGGFNGH